MRKTKAQKTEFYYTTNDEKESVRRLRSDQLTVCNFLDKKMKEIGENYGKFIADAVKKPKEREGITLPEYSFSKENWEKILHSLKVKGDVVTLYYRQTTQPVLHLKLQK